jgi:membrane-bound lytic murein transglycosylase D
MTSIKRPTLILIGIIIGLTIFLLIGFNSSKQTDSIDKTNQSTITESDSSYRLFVKDNYKIYSIPVPDQPIFAGELVPIQNIDVNERLDREMIVNTYWHSNTFLLHKRAARWFPVIEPILVENNIPNDFKYLAVIESGLDNVTSPSGAKGFWQFMKATGESYNLEINNYVDERYHLEKATQAACEYLQTAYKKFGSWTLAAASYNIGKTGLQNKLDEQKATSYYDLLLNIETGRYVYRIVAAKYILSNSKNYGFNIRQKDLYELYQTKNINIDSSINDLTNFAIQHNSNYKTIKLLNPWLRGKKLPNLNGINYTLKLPIENSNLDPVSSSIK